jgi:glucosamine--fructose-6-phosphate aminotransferase (isomerizing)
VAVHNGIIENFSQLRQQLQAKGCVFESETDTEVAVHLISSYYKGDLLSAVQRGVRRIQGSFALGVISLDEPGKIIVARRDSPLAIGLGKGENFVTSDISAVLDRTKKVIYLSDDQTALISAKEIKVFDPRGKKISPQVQAVSYDVQEAQKGGFKHFMLKEIHEQPKVISRILSHTLTPQGRLKFDHLSVSPTILRKIENIIIVACGTAYHAGLVGKYLIESLAQVPVWVDLGSEFRYRKPIIKDKTLVIAISQSGETADTLAAVREAKKSKAKVLAICNVVGSSLTREADGVIYIQAGPEISVASTKAYTAQLMVVYLLGLYLSQLKAKLSRQQFKKFIAALKQVPQKQREILQHTKSIRSIARKHLHYGAFLYLGRNINFPTALEGALKLKEISYIPAEGYAAGEMKHGPIALIDEYRAVVCIANDSFVFDKVISNVQEILARRGKIIAVASSGNKEISRHTKEVIFIPKIDDIFSPLLSVVSLQLFAYYVADLKGYDVDKPRNLAKSVTVE